MTDGVPPLPLGRDDLEGSRQVITLYLRILNAPGALARENCADHLSFASLKSVRTWLEEESMFI